MKILIASDKFKGTLTAHQACQAIARGWRRGRPDDRIQSVPVTDGGDGFGPVMGEALHSRRCILHAKDAAKRPVKASWWRSRADEAVLESAGVIGLAMLPATLRNPLELDTLGLGLALNRLHRRGIRHLVVGIGGSATNDGGFGMALARGWKFLDRRGMAIDRWTECHRLKQLVPPETPLPFDSLKVASDVSNPLLGELGATRIYGPQKGLTRKNFPKAEKALERMAEVVENTLGRPWHTVPGAGAAGGLGFALLALEQATLQSGFDLFSEAAHFEQALKDCDLVVTGEGSMDASSLMGKAAARVAERARVHGVPVHALCGRCQEAPGLRTAFDSLAAMTPSPAKEEEALAHAGKWLARIAEDLARSL